MQNMPRTCVMGIFSSVAWNEGIGKGGASFFFVDSNFSIACASLYPMEFSGILEMEAKALIFALHKIREMNSSCSNIFISSQFTSG